MLKKAVFGDVIKYYRQLADGKQAICYCTSIKHSLATSLAFNDAGISSAHIDGSTLKSERQQIINEFRKGEIQVLCNVDLISEGFDVADCECAILLRPTQSLTLYIQQAMRCMRYKDGKRAVIIDHVGNYARFGLPDADRKWSLDAKKKTKKERLENTEKGQGVTECPECFFTFASYDKDGNKLMECPECGHVFEETQRKEIQEQEAELERIEGFTLDYSDWRDCKTYQELQQYAVTHGYKKGWCFYKAKELGLIA